MVERFDESMVVLSALLKVPLGDVLYVASKNHSSSTFHGDVQKEGIQHTPIEQESEQVQKLVTAGRAQWCVGRCPAMRATAPPDHPYQRTARVHLPTYARAHFHPRCTRP